jgi:hypothetical protein
MKRRNALLSLLSAGFVIALILCALLWNATKNLQAENQELRVKITQRNSKPLVSPPAPAAAAPVDPEFESQKRELLRLRNEVAQFRSARDSAKRSEAEIAKTHGHYAITSVVPVDAPSIPSADWNFLGYATPQATLISRLWAMRTGQLATLLDTFTPEDRQKYEHIATQMQSQGKTDAEITKVFQKEFAAVTGLRVVGQHEPVEGVVILDVYMEGIGMLKKFRLNQFNNEWKMGGALNENVSVLDDQSPMTSLYYMQNPELLKRYFPQLYESLQKQRPQRAETQLER